MIKESSKNKKIKRLTFILTIMLLFVTICNFLPNNVIFAETNSNYTDQDAFQVDDLDKSIKQNFLIDILGSFIYGLASIVEGLVSWVFELFTGVNSFPWADKIIFNAIPLLDVNFINPSDGSLFSTEAAIDSIIKNSYYTVFTLGVAFLGVAIGVMAIRIVFASIASEKAKYKELVTQAAIAILLLFMSHYFISFIFFINEKMVEVASSIFSQAVEKVDNNVSLTVISDEKKSDVVHQFQKDINSLNFTKLMKLNFMCPTYWINYIRGSIGEVNALIQEIKGNPNKHSGLDDPKYRDYVYYLLTDQYYVKKELSNVYSRGQNVIDNLLLAAKVVIYDDSTDQIENLIQDVRFLAELEAYKNTKSDLKLKDVKTAINEYVDNNRGGKDYLKNILLSAWGEKNLTDDKVSKNNTFQGIGQFFKENAWTYATDSNGKIKGWKAGKNSIISTLLYAIFILQSIMYFVSYFKRFFYILVLAMFAPIVVVFDFLTKVIN